MPTFNEMMYGIWVKYKNKLNTPEKLNKIVKIKHFVTFALGSQFVSLLDSF